MSEQLAASSDEMSFKELIQKIKDWWRYLKTQWLKIAFAVLIGGVMGFIYAWMQPITYSSKITFVVEEGKNGGSGLGGLASLAGQFGVDVGGSSGGGVLSGDNILLYFKSVSLSREVLLSPCDEKSNESIADRYVKVYGLKKKWEENKSIGVLNFPIYKIGQKYSRLQDSLLQAITFSILKNKFTIAKSDKKASFLELSATFENEDLAKLYNEKILQRAIDNYIETKTLRQQNTVKNLQDRADSIMSLLGKKTSVAASLATNSATMDLNPLYKTGTAIAVENTSREKTILTTMFAEIVKNLELAKFTLGQGTPVIQIVDKSNFPLTKNKLSTRLYFVIGGIIALFLIVFFLFIIRITKSL